MSTGNMSGLGLNGGAPASTLRGGKQAIYESVLHQLRILMIDHMAKPEEVLYSLYCVAFILLCLYLD